MISVQYYMSVTVLFLGGRFFRDTVYITLLLVSIS